MALQSPTASPASTPPGSPTAEQIHQGLQTLKGGSPRASSTASSTSASPLLARSAQSGGKAEDVQGMKVREVIAEVAKAGDFEAALAAAVEGGTQNLFRKSAIDELTGMLQKVNDQGSNVSTEDVLEWMSQKVRTIETRLIPVLKDKLKPGEDASQVQQILSQAILSNAQKIGTDLIAKLQEGDLPVLDEAQEDAIRKGINEAFTDPVSVITRPVTSPLGWFYKAVAIAFTAFNATNYLNLADAKSLLPEMLESLLNTADEHLHGYAVHAIVILFSIVIMSLIESCIWCQRSDDAKEKQD